MKSIIQAQAEEDIMSGSKEDDFKDNNQRNEDVEAKNFIRSILGNLCILTTIRQ